MQFYFSASVSTCTVGVMKQQEGLNRESNTLMNNAEVGKRPSWSAAHFLTDTITSDVPLDGIRKV